MYQPSQTVLKKYADVLVNFALNSGKGTKSGEVVQCIVPDVAKPILAPLQETILKANAHPLLRLIPTGLDKPFYQLANDKQLTFFPKKYHQARVNLIDHSIGIIADHDLHELETIDPKKIIQAAESKNKIREWFDDKEYAGKFTWVGALYGTPSMAKEANLSLRQYWQQIIKACFLDYADPIRKWRQVFTEQARIKKELNALSIDRLHIKAKHINLWLTLGKKRQWAGGSGRNIPSFEIFVSPDWRGTQGYIEFNQPLYRYGNLIQGIRLEFNQGRVTKAIAKKGNQLLQQILTRKNADKVGEFSLTDSRMSRITKFMAETLYDENIGGQYGNTHIALGNSYKDTYAGDPRKPTQKQWNQLGFNKSGEHCDIITTENRTVIAYLNNKPKQVIYQQGKFTL